MLFGITHNNDVVVLYVVHYEFIKTTTRLVQGRSW